MKLGIIAGNRLLPVILAKEIKRKYPDFDLVAICFKQETSSEIKKYADRCYWLDVTNLASLKDVIKKEELTECVMAGQISPVRIFNRKKWDSELLRLVNETKDMRPHSIFTNIINYIEKEGIKFLDSTMYLKEILAHDGVMNDAIITNEISEDINFGMNMASRFVDLDIGQTIIVKHKSVVALEALEGTDNTILRGYKLAGRGCVVLKFSKTNQDLRFDVPVVGVGTLNLLRRIKAKAIVLEAGKVLILEKGKFLTEANKSNIAVLGRIKN